MTDTPGTPGPSDRLDRIEALLEASIQQHNREMAEIRASQGRTQMLVEQNAAGLRETRAIADSNSRSVAAWENRFTEIEEETQEATSSTRADLSERIESQSERIERVEQQSEDDWTRFDQRHEEHAQRFNTLLEEARADRQEWRRRFDEQQEAWNRRFDEALAQIRQIWQRLAS